MSLIPNFTGTKSLHWYGWPHFISVRIRPLKFARQMLCKHRWSKPDRDQGPGPGGPTKWCEKCKRLGYYESGRWQYSVGWPYGQFFPWER